MDDPHLCHAQHQTARFRREELIYDQVTPAPIRSMIWARWQPKSRCADFNGPTAVMCVAEHWFLRAWMKHGFHEDGLSRRCRMLVQGLRAKGPRWSLAPNDSARGSYSGAFTYHGRRGRSKTAFAILSIMWWLDAEADLQRPRYWAQPRRCDIPGGTRSHGGPKGAGPAGPLGCAMFWRSITSPASARIEPDGTASGSGAGFNAR